MKRILELCFLILFATGVFPIFEDDRPSLVVDKPKRTDSPLVVKHLSQFKDGDVLASVNNKTIKFSDIKLWYANCLQNHLNLYPEIPLSPQAVLGYRKTCLEKGILKEILSEEIDRLKLSLPDEEVDKELNKIKSRFPSVLEFEKFLSLSGITPERFRDEFKFQMEVTKLMQTFEKQAKIPKGAGVKKWYEANQKEFLLPRKIRYSVILLKNPEEGMNKGYPKNKELMEKIRADILAGKKTFEFFAKNYSDDPSRKNNGDMGMFPVDQLKDCFGLLKNFPKGELTPVFQSPEGYYIAKITEEIPQKVEEFEKVKEVAEKMASETALFDNQQKIIEELKQKAKIQILDPELKNEKPVEKK